MDAFAKSGKEPEVSTRRLRAQTSKSYDCERELEELTEVKGEEDNGRGSEEDSEVTRLRNQDDSTGSDSDPEEVTQLQEEDDGASRDNPWGWVIALGVFVNYVLLTGYLKSSGLFFVELLQRFQASASHTALYFTIRNSVYCICGFFVMNVLVGRCEIRHLVLLGGALTALSAILSSFANDLTLLICLQSGLLAVGQSMLISPGQVLVGQYFHKWRNLALAFSECGVSVGYMLIPLLISYFLEQYALQGTLLLYGGICLNCLPAALLHRPFHSKRRPCRQQRERKSVSLEDALTDVHGDLNSSDAKHSSLTLVSDDVGECPNSGSRQLAQEDSQSLVEARDKAASKSVKANTIPDYEISGGDDEIVGDADPETLSKRGSRLKDEESHRSSRCVQCSACSPFWSLFNVSLFKDPIFRVFIVYASICGIVNIPVDYLPALVSHHDVTESQAAMLLSVIGGLDLVCRVACVGIAGSNRVRISTVVLLSYLVLAVVMQFVRFMRSFQHFLALAVMQGLLGSVGNCLFPQLVIEMVGVERMGQAVGWTQLCAIIMTPVYPLLGYVHDVTGSYVLVYHIIGLGMLACGVMLCFAWPVRRCMERKQRQRTDG